MRDISKYYGNVAANSHVNFSVQKGEIHSLLGENGAGKTTLMKILYGMTQPDSGTISVGGKKVRIRNPKDAINLGIGMVHQHFMLAAPLTVAENIVLGYEPKKGMFFDFEGAVKEIEALSEQYGLKIDPRAKIQDIPVGQKQRVEIIKALYRKSDLIILDEPTAVLTALEVQELFGVLKGLKEAGKTIIIITHKLKEIMQVSDRVTILRSGEFVCTKNTADTNPNELAELMVGRKVHAMEESFGGDVDESAPVFLEVKDAVYKEHKVKKLNGLSLKVRSGEILGICGVEGNGQTQLIETVTGIIKLRHGKVLVRGEEVKDPTPLRMLNLGVAHIPEDRASRGLIKDFPIRENTILGYHRRRQFSRRGVLNIREMNRYAQEMVENFGIKVGSIYDPVSSLSGGNQQKVVIGRALSQNPDIIIAAQPTRGVDIGAIEYIHEKLIEMKKQGKAILLISAEIDELMALSDNIAVIFGGQIVAQGKASEFDERRLGMLMTGYGKEEKEHGSH
ncbi:ABC transporter ATP-binding protein [Oscillospiraceae bacterium NSJ-54]|uniref:ABC transporter ATP-binding protein n=2 Tax=Zongyangia hominis TaxID=2763677 RepID=A0A926EC78_9FIRM|nr:ABC transporter ATP-binding protein [Zongyangia hominis]